MSNSPDSPQGSQPTSPDADATGRFILAGVLIGVVAISVVITLMVSRDAERENVHLEWDLGVPE